MNTGIRFLAGSSGYHYARILYKLRNERQKTVGAELRRHIESARMVQAWQCPRAAREPCAPHVL